MSESNILDSLEKFKAKYAWDKSLVTGQPAPSARLLEVDSSIQDYLQDMQAARQSDALALVPSEVL
jgi:hypothetical protein